MVFDGNISLPPTTGLCAAKASAETLIAIAMTDFFIGFSFRELDASIGNTEVRGEWIGGRIQKSEFRIQNEHVGCATRTSGILTSEFCILLTALPTIPATSLAPTRPSDCRA